MVRSVCLGVVCLCFLAAAASIEAAEHALALYSWKPAGKTWHFVLIPDPFPRPVSTAKVLKAASPLVGVDALKARLAATPHSDSAIVWRDLPPEHVLRYPPKGTCDDIIAFGRQHGLNIERWPTVDE